MIIHFTSFQRQNQTKIIPNVLTFGILPLLFVYKLSPSATLFNLLTSIHQAGLSSAIISFRQPSTFHLNQRFPRGCNCAPPFRGQLAMSGITFMGKGTTGIQWVEARDPAKPLTIYRTTPTQRCICLKCQQDRY